MNAESQLFKNSPFRFDHLGLQIDIVLIKNHRYQGLLSADLFDVVEHINDVPNAPRGFLNFGRQANAAHRRRFHTVPYEGLRVEEPLEQHLPSCHGHLGQFQQNPGRLDQLATQNSQVNFRFVFQSIHLRGRQIELRLREETVFQRKNYFPVRALLLAL